MYRYSDFDADFVARRNAQFRAQVARRLSGALTEEEFKPLRLMNGVYLQLHAYMLRVAIPYGTLRAAQMRRLADIAERWDRGFGHFTTRQNIQFNRPRHADIALHSHRGHRVISGRSRAARRAAQPPEPARTARMTTIPALPAQQQLLTDCGAQKRGKARMSVIVTDRGFAPDDWTAPVPGLAEASDTAEAAELPPDADPQAALAALPRARLLRVRFESFADGRGFTLARRLREAGFSGRLRAAPRLPVAPSRAFCLIRGRCARWPAASAQLRPCLRPWRVLS